MKKIVSTAMAFMLSFGFVSSLAGCDDKKTERTKINTYSVSATSSAGGSISASKTSVEEGDVVVFTLTTQAGYDLQSFTVNGGEIMPAVQSKKDGVTVYEYTVKNALRNYEAKASFAQTNIVVSFTGEHIQNIENKQVAFGGRFGELPTPFYAGKRFVGWKNQKGEIVNQASAIEEYGDIQLTAVWEEISETEKEKLVPFSATTTYFDGAATAYGVVWHTEVAPIAPVVQIVKGSTADFTSAIEVEGDAEEWILNEYTVSAVVDGLEFGTEYTVRFGDRAADVWGEHYTFTTRAEQIDTAKFFYVADTQEYRPFANRADGVKLTDANGEVVLDSYWNQTMRDAVARFPEAQFVAHGGDMVNYGGSQASWREMLDSIESYLFDLPTVFSAGNHEDPNWYSAGYDTVNKLFHVDAPEDDNKRGDYYSFDYGPMHFISLRSNDVFANSGRLSETQVAWLKTDVEKAKANPNIKWTVAMMHEGPIVPCFTSAGSNYHQDTLGAQVIPLFDELSIDLLLFGHNHFTMTSYPLVWDKNAEPTLKDGLKVSAVTKQTQKVTHDGTQVEKFVYGNDVTKRGTVYHQTGTAGHGYDDRYKLVDLSKNIEKYVNYRMLLSGEKGYIDDKARTMYSYIEVSANQLVVRTYGVDVQGIAKKTENTTDCGIYLDGFMLEK